MTSCVSCARFLTASSCFWAPGCGISFGFLGFAWKVMTSSSHSPHNAWACIKERILIRLILTGHLSGGLPASTWMFSASFSHISPVQYSRYSSYLRRRAVHESGKTSVDFRGVKLSSHTLRHLNPQQLRDDACQNKNNDEGRAYHLSLSGQAPLQCLPETLKVCL